MLVSEYVEHLVQIRPYKYATKQTLIRDVKKLAIWDKDIFDGYSEAWSQKTFPTSSIRHLMNQVQILEK